VSEIVLGARATDSASVPAHLLHLARQELIGIPEEQLWSIRWVGSPGGGKTQAMGLTLDQLIGRRWGGMILDPKGELVTIHCRRTRHPERVVLVAPGLTARRWAHNFLALDRAHPRADKIAPIVASSAVAMFEHIGRAFLDTNTNIRTYLMAAVDLALRQPAPTLIDAALILIHWGFRQRVLLRPGVTDEDRAFWAKYEEYTDYMQQTQAASTINRFWELLRYPAVRDFIAPHRSTLDPVRLMNAGYVVAVDLRTGLAAREGELLGNILMAIVVNAYGLRRSGLLDGDTGRPWFIAADEFHRLAPAPFAELITQGRAFRVFPLVAHQDDSQLAEADPTIAAALAHTPADLSLYRSREDLARLDRSAADRDFVARVRRLRRFQAVLHLRTTERGTETLTIDLPADDRHDSASQWAALMRPQDDPAQDVPGATRLTYRPEEIPPLSAWLRDLPATKPRKWDDWGDEERRRYLSATKEGDDDAEETTADTASPTGQTPPAPGADQPGPDPLDGAAIPDGDDPAGGGRGGRPAQLSFPVGGAGGAPRLQRDRRRRG
jgi:hypothetical protein